MTFDSSRVEIHFREEYLEGYEDASKGLDLSDEKYPGSGHERDTTYQDEQAFAYYCGQSDWEEV
jgi:hypothetical protein